MKTTIASVLAFLMLGSAAMLPASDANIPDGSLSVPVESAGFSALPDEGEAAQEDCSMPEDPAPESGQDAGGDDADTVESEVDSDGEGMEEPLPDDGSEAGAPEEPDAEESMGVILSGDYALQLAAGQADSIMGAHGMIRSADCAQAVAVLALSEYAGATEDEAYFKVWEALNAVLVAQAANGVTAANCSFADGCISVWV